MVSRESPRDVKPLPWEALPSSGDITVFLWPIRAARSETGSGRCWTRSTRPIVVESQSGEGGCNFGRFLDEVRTTLHQSTILPSAGRFFFLETALQNQ